MHPFLVVVRLGCPLTDVKDTGQVCRTIAQKRLAPSISVPCFALGVNGVSDH